VLPSNVANYERCRGDFVAVPNGPVRAVAAHRVAPARFSAASNDVPDLQRVISDISFSTGKQREEDLDVVDIGVTPPVVHDVKLCPRNNVGQLSARRQRAVRSWRSTESIDRLIATPSTPDSSSGGVGDGGGLVARSSFVDPLTSLSTATTTTTRRSVYIDLGDYQTLLKHGLRAFLSSFFLTVLTN